jgi:copper resistance protein B
MQTRNRCLAPLLVTILMSANPAFSLNQPGTVGHDRSRKSAEQHQDTHPTEPEAPQLPEGVSLDEVLDYSAKPPPPHFPDPVPDDQLFAFTLIEQLEYRFADGNTPDHLGWDAQGWIGGDFNKFLWKNEGEAIFDGPDQGETETDLLYSRLVTPFWSFQVGMQYANEWTSGDYEDRWSAVIALQGVAPFEFEFDNSLYISEEGDVTLACEIEYDLRITQRLVLQPRTELGFAARDIPERDLGAGMTDAKIELRLRYEIRREFAPYIGFRYQFLVGETDNIAEAAGADSAQWFLTAGSLFAF